MATVLDLVSASLREIGAFAAGETLPYDDAHDAFLRLNRFLDRMAGENLTIYSITRSTSTLTASQASFTVGSGGNINITRPTFIDRVSFIDTSMDPDAEFSLGTLMTEQEYQSVTLKALTSTYPQRAYYNPTYPLGTLIPWPIPTSSTLQWVIYHYAAVPQFAALSTTISLPPSYYEFLVQNLALLLCPSYERQPHPVLVKSAADSMATMKRLNFRESELTFPPDVRGDRGDYWPGTYWIYEV